MQLVGKGAQDVLFTGNPSFTHFRAMYKRHTEFAMEHFRLYFKTTNLSLPQAGTLTLKVKVDRNAQLLHDCYLSVTLPDIYSPIVPQPNGSVVGSEFRWVENLGYNMINYVAVTINGSEVVRHTGEWMKLYAALQFPKNKKDILDIMTGNIPQNHDPANSYDRINQYPHAIYYGGPPAPSITGSVLSIPLHFWFCESIGHALPLIALQHSEVEFVVELKNMYQLFTVIDTRSTINGTPNPTFNKRIAGIPSTMNAFLSPPNVFQQPSNSALITWNLNPFIEANYIFVSDAEMAHIATTDHSFLITQIDVTRGDGLYGPSVDLEILMKNMVTRVVWVAQRNDRSLINDYDNYTNWEDPNKPPFAGFDLYSSGSQQLSGIFEKNILLESSIIIDGKERFGFKQTEFFDHIQHYRHHEGTTTTQLPGIYAYSFSADHKFGQPSGAINGSQFNKIILRNTYVQPLTNAVFTGVTPNTLPVCILKSTANNPNPTVVTNPNAIGSNGKPLYGPNDLITVYRKTSANTFVYTYQLRAFVESYNFLRVISGIANVVFSS
jgi:hypothetical protein